ncbi:hypothetical protein NMY22_g8213 [Coprinellus aureogranulatus]|nr:hypothetical protein NMY22_g8213 [Coprinellus aureogranulatus]
MTGVPARSSSDDDPVLTGQSVRVDISSLRHTGETARRGSPHMEIAMDKRESFVFDFTVLRARHATGATSRGEQVPLSLSSPNSLIAEHHGRRRLIIRLTSEVGSAIGFAILTLIVGFRVYALCEKRRKVLYSVCALWVLVCLVGGYTGLQIILAYARVLRSLRDVRPPYDHLYGPKFFIRENAAQKTKHGHILAMVICTVSGASAVVMTFVRLRDCITDIDGRIRFDCLRKLSCITPIAGAMLNDTAVSFTMLIGLEFATAVCGLDNTISYYAPTWPWMHALFSHTGSHLILNLRRAGGRGTPTSLIRRQDRTLDLEAICVRLSKPSAT